MKILGSETGPRYTMYGHPIGQFGQAHLFDEMATKREEFIRDQKKTLSELKFETAAIDRRVEDYIDRTDPLMRAHDEAEREKQGGLVPRYRNLKQEQRELDNVLTSGKSLLVPRENLEKRKKELEKKLREARKELEAAQAKVVKTHQALPKELQDASLDHEPQGAFIERMSNVEPS